MGKVVLVTGVSRDLGRRFARRLSADPGVDRVIGVDAVPPRDDIGDVSFVRADIRNPVIAKVIAKEDVDTVVHMSVIATPGSAGGRGTMKELNVIGTMQLLAACQKAESIRHLVVKSTSTVYGASSRDPAMFTEDMEPRRQPQLRLRQGRLRDRGLRPRLRPPSAGRPGHDAAPGQRPRPARHQPHHVVLPAAGDPDGARLRPPDAVRARERPDARPHPLRQHRGARHVQRRRRRRDAAVPGRTPPPQAVGAARPARGRRRRVRAQVLPDGRLLARAARSSSPSGAASTPRGCAPSSGSSRSSPPSRPSPTSPQGSATSRARSSGWSAGSRPHYPPRR